MQASKNENAQTTALVQTIEKNLHKNSTVIVHNPSHVPIVCLSAIKAEKGVHTQIAIRRTVTNPAVKLVLLCFCRAWQCWDFIDNVTFIHAHKNRAANPPTQIYD